jgi:inhibitor of cysteine peptidase
MWRRVHAIFSCALTTALLCVAVASISCRAQKAGASLLRIDQSYDGKEVSAKKLDQLELSLPENPTTGYRWNLKSTGEPVCKLDGSDSDAPAGGVGRGIIRHWRFTVVAPGMSTIDLENRREFETDKPPAKTFTIRLRAVE